MKKLLYVQCVLPYKRTGLSSTIYIDSYEIDSNHYLFSPPWKKYGSKGVAEIITTSFSKESVEPQEVRYYDARSDGGGEKCDGGSSGNRWGHRNI